MSKNGTSRHTAPSGAAAGSGQASGVGARQRRQERIGWLAAALTVVAALYLLRLAALQAPSLWPGRASELTMRAVAQRQEALVLDSGRGHFTDRNGKPVTGGQIYAVAAFPLASGDRGTPAQIAALATAVGAPADKLSAWLDGLREPAFWRGADGLGAPAAYGEAELGQVRAAGVSGVYALPYRLRQPDGEPGIHALGYISQHPEALAQLYASELARGRMRLSEEVGGAGAERALDRLLRGAGPTVARRSRVAAPTGAAGAYAGRAGAAETLAGAAERAGAGREAAHELRVTRPDNPHYPLEVRTTLDIALQRELERYAEREGLKEGAIVVLDAGNADILAMVSRPAFDPYRLDRDGSDLANHALRAAAPGSVFKLVTEAAALETGKAKERETFRCDGEYGQYGLSCWLPGGHGELTLAEALAHSCNVVFAQVAERLSEAELARTADRLGLGRQVGWHAERSDGPYGGPLRPLPEEEAGRVFLGPLTEHDGGLLAQTGIGQRDAAVTPLQAANLVVTLLHGGRVLAPRLVTDIRYADGMRMAELPAQEAPSRYGRIAPATAGALLRGMEAVVAEGTGRSIRRGEWAVAGKSGTAQTTAAGAPANHQWFVGYGPAKAPRYAVAVLAENRPAGSPHQAAAMFRGVMDIIAAHEKASASES